MQKIIEGLAHVPQGDENSCGPSVLAMVAKRFGANHGSDDVGHWVGILNPSEEEGTPNGKLAEVAHDHFECDKKAPAEWEDLVQAIDAGHPAVVNFLVRGVGPLANEGRYVEFETGLTHEEKDGHYAVAMGYTTPAHPWGEGLLILDPKLAPEPTWMGRSEFESRWRAYYADWIRWMVVVRGLKVRIAMSLE